MSNITRRVCQLLLGGLCLTAGSVSAGRAFYLAADASATLEAMGRLEHLQASTASVPPFLWDRPPGVNWRARCGGSNNGERTLMIVGETCRGCEPTVNEMFDVLEERSGTIELFVAASDVTRYRQQIESMCKDGFSFVLWEFHDEEAFASWSGLSTHPSLVQLDAAGRLRCVSVGFISPASLRQCFETSVSPEHPFMLRGSSQPPGPLE